ncbi:interleukin-1 receptor-associated kinase 4 isoform X1 [Anguilla anguilla]|uniref:interleukin-1 receptor-associated kinase 4 isoform X1 n=2 Tax=Anguilla anguilla TaxID=7936 RepID=UPI0015B31038|nr:interleukin-1 receptor-associated kinase 4 isoform X1 [Anguilla anguilla]
MNLKVKNSFTIIQGSCSILETPRQYCEQLVQCHIKYNFKQIVDTFVTTDVRMNNGITSATFVRSLKHSTLRQLSDFLDPQDSWKKVLGDIHKPTGEPRYTQLHLRRFEGLVSMGRSPTMELLHDWGTTNCTVGELVDILCRHQLLAAASLLLPGTIKMDPGVQCNVPVQECLSPSNQVTRVIGQKERASECPLPDSTSAPGEKEEEPDDTGFYRFSYDRLAKMTGGFDERPAAEGGRRLGEGGFGVVYRGCFKGRQVAVKKLNCMDDICPQELNIQFNQEIQTLKMLKHVNLVEMVGFSSDGDHPCLVYEYMSNGSLLDKLACLGGCPPLSWSRRCAIAVGTARGLEYLHANHHVHRDIKSGNILLDEAMAPRISDFGLTRASAKRTSSTALTEKIVGTTAYMAPEALRGEISPKSDIFSFGVVLLEVLSGLPPVDDSREPQFLMEMKDEIEDEEMTLEDFVDKKMEGREPLAVERMFSLAQRCLNERKGRRPDVKQVLNQLEDILAASSER